MFYSIIKLYNNDVEYNLVWHEDVGNYIYRTEQDEITVNDLDRKLIEVTSELNKIIK